MTSYSRPHFIAFLLAAFHGIAGAPALRAEPVKSQPEGIMNPIPLPPFKEVHTLCAKPPGLSRKLIFAQDNERQFMNGVAAGLAAAAQDRGLAFEVAVANNDPRTMIEQVERAYETSTGALVAAPVNPASLSRSLQRIIWSGGYVGTVVPPPAVSLLNAAQYLTGKILGDAAATYITRELSGKAKVVILTHDKLQFLAPRFTAIRDVLRDMPGVEIVADISPVTVDNEGGKSMMKTILLAESNIDVVLGADTAVLGALAALREAGKARPGQFLGGIDGEPEALAEIKARGPYRATVSLASPIFAYAMGQHAADWLEGKSIPQALEILPTLLDAKNLSTYEADLSSPGKVFADPQRRSKYLKMYGNICFDTRGQYINFAWSPERN